MEESVDGDAASHLHGTTGPRDGRWIADAFPFHTFQAVAIDDLHLGRTSQSLSPTRGRPSSILIVSNKVIVPFPISSATSYFPPSSASICLTHALLFVILRSLRFLSRNENTYKYIYTKCQKKSFASRIDRSTNLRDDSVEHFRSTSLEMCEGIVG